MLSFLFKKSIAKRIVFSFASVIFIGSILLSLPISQLPTSTSSYFDHLFTSVSMVCVTGLSTKAVADTYSIFGQVICMLLIQIGGLGLMSLLGFILFQTGKQLSLIDKLALQESLNNDNANNFKHFLSTIIRYTLTIECLGAMLLSFRFIPMFGWKKGLFTSFFIAISAFCNAGFDNLGSNSLLDYAFDPLLNITIATLILLGGLGFSVWIDIKRSFVQYHQSTKGVWRRPIYKRLSFHTRVVLRITMTILLIGTMLTFVSEFHNIETIGSLSISNKLLVSAFQTVTMRTAGFATLDYTKVYPITMLLYIGQMFIGGSPGGTAGGMKTTTFLVVLLYIVSEIKGRKHTNFMNHTFSVLLIRKSLMIFTVFSLTFLTGIMVLSITDGTHNFLFLVFETISALATVGVTANTTAALSTFGQCVIMLLMFIGRIGPLTILVSFNESTQKKILLNYVNARLLIG